MHHLQNLLRRILFCKSKRLHHPVRSEELVFRICGFSHTICIKEQLCSRIHLKLILAVLHAFHTADDKAVLIMDQLEMFPRLLQYRILMSRICSHQFSTFEIQGAEPYGDEHFLPVVQADLTVHIFQHLLRLQSHGSIVLNQDL